MADFPKFSLASAGHTLSSVAKARRTRRIAIGVAIAIVVYALLGFFAAPALIRQQAERQLSVQLDRPTTIAQIKLNPFTLRFEAQGIRIAEAATKPAASSDSQTKTSSAPDFITVDRLLVRPSWMSLFRFAPVIKEVRIDSPHLSVARYDANRFNFSDLIDKFSTPSAPARADDKPARFSVSNILINDGRIDFNDHLLNARHVVDGLAVGIPFVATLASDTDIFVTPSLQARIDGSPLSVTGRTKPFAQSRESDVALKLDGLDLPRIASYLPTSVPVVVKNGALSTNLNVRFAITGDTPTIGIDGTADLVHLDVTDRSNAPLIAAKALHVSLTNTQPLLGLYRFDEVKLSAPEIHVTRDSSGMSNFEKLAASSGTAPASHPATPQTAASQSAPSQAAAPALDLAVKHFIVDSGKISVDDDTMTPRISLGLSKLMVDVKDFSTLGKTPSPYTLQSSIDSGGTLNVSGGVTLAAKQTNLKLALDGLALPPLQPYLGNALAAKLTSGALSVSLPVDVNWSTPQPAIVVGAGDLTLRTVKLEPTLGIAPITLEQAVATVRKIDVGAQTAALDNVQIRGLTLTAKRLKNGSIDLASLADGGQAMGKTKVITSAPTRGTGKTTTAAVTPSAVTPSSTAAVAQASTSAAAPASAGGWHYQIGQIAVTDTTADFVDQSTPRLVKLHVAPLQLSIQSFSDDLRKPLPVEGQLTLNGSGTLAVRGTITPEPLKLALHIDAKQLDAAAFEPYLGDTLNVRMANARLNVAGDATVTLADKDANKNRRNNKNQSADGSKLTANYNGNVSLTNVKMVDKVSKDVVAGWQLLGASGLKVAYSEKSTSIDAARVTFARFFGRVLLDAQGKLNLSDIVASDATNNGAVKETNKDANKKASTAAVTPPPAEPKPSSTTAPMNLRFGQLVFEDGRVTYTDNFVRPNYTANLIAINGTVGTISSRATVPAPVDVVANLSGNGPVSIKGTINPLIDKPALDLSATAHDIGLTDLTPYSSKYLGYPITKGKLNVDLHYALADDRLSANNHIFIDQLTFGDAVDSPGATHLPVRLAVSLLKNSRGEIDVNIPVSGSLSNPEFSVGSIVWHAILNLIQRAVTAPFTLLAHAFGGGNGGDAAQYAAFEPGSADLSEAARKNLDLIGSALADKPSIRIELTPHVDPRLDAPALRTAYLEQQVRLAKLQDTKGQKDGAAADTSKVTVAANEYDKYLTKAYKSADFKKPRNIIGMTKTLPDTDMEKAMTENAPVDEAALKTLAQQRATAVQDYLGKKIDLKRITIQSASSNPATASPDQAASGPVASTRVDFGLK